MKIILKAWLKTKTKYKIQKGKDSKTNAGSERGGQPQQMDLMTGNITMVWNITTVSNITMVADITMVAEIFAF